MLLEKVDVKNLDRTRFNLSVVSYTLPEHIFNTLSAFIDENGEPQVAVSGNENIALSKSMFLFWLRTYIGPEADKDTPKQFVEPILDVNVFLMDLLVNKNLKDISIYSRGLLHYFSKLADWGCDWRDMPHIESKRPTYRFKRYLEESYRSKNKAEHIAAGTANGYMRAVISFYKFYLKQGENFINRPFEYEMLSINIHSDYTNVKASKSLIVQSTDLRLNVPKAQAGIIPRHLRALSEHEWLVLDKILRQDRTVLKSEYGQYTKVRLPIEFSLVFLLMRHSGMRREEALTFNEDLLLTLLPKAAAEPAYIAFDIGPKQGVQTKNDKEREIEVPTGLIAQLRKYSVKKRFADRKHRFLAKNPDASRVPLFLNQSGQPIDKNTVNARWCEIRNSMENICDGEFTHKPHNLRSSYAVQRLFSLLDAGMPQSKALTFVQSRLGHSDIGTTLHYLQQLEGKKSPDELAEIAIAHLFDIAEREHC